MPRAKMIYISDEAHRQLKVLAMRRRRPMGEVVEELVAQELVELATPWIAPEGLWLQHQALANVWDDPTLDVYNDG